MVFTLVPYTFTGDSLGPLVQNHSPNARRWTTQAAKLATVISNVRRMNRPVKTLIHVEIFTELDRPQFHEAWIEFSSRFMAGMLSSGHTATPDTVRLLTNEALAELGPKHGFWDNLITVIPERPFLDIFGTDYLTATVSGYQGTTDDAVLDKAAQFVRDRLGSFVPDVILTYTTAPWLRRAFPDALILHKEYGAFSRPPYPESFYLDPNGKFANATINTHAVELRTYQASDAERGMIQDMRRVFRDSTIKKISPFHHIEPLMRRERKKIMLLPLQFCGHYGFEGTCKYRTQGELLRDVVERTDPDIGILVINHSTAQHHSTIPPNDLYVYLSKHHDNLFFNNDFNRVVHPSQYLLAHVDMVATVSSSVGLQALLWNKPIIALGDSHINAVADYASLEDVSADTPTEPTWDKTGAFAWLLRHYYIPASYYRTPGWLGDFAERSMTNWREGRRGLDFFEPIDTPEAIAKAWIDNIDLRVPKIRNTAPETTTVPITRVSAEPAKAQ